MKTAAIAALVAASFSANAQELLDRVLARVNGRAITLSDARAATGLGLVDIPAGVDSLAGVVRALIDRQLMLAEVARYSPPEPPASSLDREAAALTERAGPGLDTLMKITGLNAARIRELARDNLRIEAYVNQRFGGAAQVSDDDVARYFQAHPEEFRRNGTQVPFDEAASRARELAGSERREAAVEQWVRDLRARGSIVCQLDEVVCKTIVY